jgi:hypothetical protein
MPPMTSMPMTSGCDELHFAYDGRPFYQQPFPIKLAAVAPSGLRFQLAVSRFCKIGDGQALMAILQISRVQKTAPYPLMQPPFALS